MDVKDRLMSEDDIIPGFPFFAPDWTEELKPVLYLVKVAYNTSAIGEYDYVPNIPHESLNYSVRSRYLTE